MPLVVWTGPIIGFAVHAGAACAVLLHAIRRPRRLDLPRCRKCGLDLRSIRPDDDPAIKCPGCAAHLTATRAVRFGRGRLRIAWLIAALLLLVTTPLWPWAASRPRPAPPRYLRYSAISALPITIPADISTAPSFPWSYVVLAVKDGNVTKPQAARLLARANNELAKSNATVPLPPFDQDAMDAIIAMLSRDLITTNDVAVYMRSALSKRISLDLKTLCMAHEPYVGSVDFSGVNPDNLVCWDIRSITTASGEAVPFQYKPNPAPPHGYSRSPAADHKRSFTLSCNLEPGEYDVVVNLLVWPNIGTGMPRAPNHEWVTPTPLKLRITSGIELVDDPEPLQRLREVIRVKACYVQPGLMQHHLKVEWEKPPMDRRPIPTFCYDVFVQIGPHSFGENRIQFPRAPSDGVSPFLRTFSYPLKQNIDPEYTRAIVRLIPNIAEIQKLSGADRLPRQSIEFDVNLQRFDLLDDAATNNRAGGR